MTMTNLAATEAATDAPTPTDTGLAIAAPLAATAVDDPALLLLKRMSDPGYLMTVEDVAAYLRVPVGTVRKWREKDCGPTARPIGKYLRYRAGDVIAWFESQ